MAAPSTAITNVHVFDGTRLKELRTVVIENGRISNSTTADSTFDGHGNRDSTTDITATPAIQGAWIAGARVR